MNPHTNATFSGVMPGNSMGRDSRIGTYSHDPMPSTAKDK